MPIYAKFEFNHAWLVDPDMRTLKMFSLHEGRWLLDCAFKADDEVCAPPFQAITFNLGGLWP